VNGEFNWVAMAILFLRGGTGNKKNLVTNHCMTAGAYDSWASGDIES